MPFPPGSQSIPNCAKAFLYQMDDLYYYDTVDCVTGDTGFGVHHSHFVPEDPCCDGEECKPGHTITPTKLPMPAQKSDKDKERKGRFRPDKSFGEALEEDLEIFVEERADKVFDVADRRRELAEWLHTKDGGRSRILQILDQRPPLRDALLESIYRELSSVRGEWPGAKVFLTQDRDLERRDVPSVAAKTAPELLGTDTQAPTQANTVAHDLDFTEGGETSPYVKVHITANAHKKGRDVFFRLYKVTYDGPGGTTITHYLGKQLAHENCIPVGDTKPLQKNKITEVFFADRHAHFHVLKATPDGGAEQQFLVYSSGDISARELVV